MTLRHFFTTAISSIGLYATFGTAVAQTTIDPHSPHINAAACAVSLQLARIALTQGMLGDINTPPASKKYKEYSVLLSAHRKTLEKNTPTEPNFRQSWSAVTEMVDKKTLRGQNGKMTLKESLGNPVDFYQKENTFIDLRCR